MKPSFRPTEASRQTPPSEALSLPGTVEVNAAIRNLFGMDAVSPLSPQDFDHTVLYGDQPSETSMIEVGGRQYGVEIYEPDPAVDRGIWMVAQHGYGGNPSDWSRLASLLRKEGIGVASLGMHVQGKDAFERMSMRVGEWARVAREAPDHIGQTKGKKLIFAGQSSGGSSGAALMTGGKNTHPYGAALLIGPTLITPLPDDLITEMDRRVGTIIKDQRDVMLSWDWFTLAIHHMHDAALNRAYQAYCTTLPGYPLRSARECTVVPEDMILAKLSGIDVPTTFVKGQKDDVDTMSLPALQSILAEKPNPFIRIAQEPEETGHQMHIENPQFTAGIVKELVRDLCD